MKKSVFGLLVFLVTPLTFQLRAILASRRMTYVELSALTGLSRETLRNIACGNNQTAKGRAKIENALGVQIFGTEKSAPPAAQQRGVSDAPGQPSSSS